MFLSLLGMLTLLSLLSASHGSLTGSWVEMIAKAFGLGRFVFPFGLLLAGLWLVLRNFERIPQLSLERLLGFTLLFVNLLVVVHFASYLADQKDIIAMAEAGSGGGYAGALVLEILLTSLGRGGTGVALLAWLLIALALSLDVTILELFGWIPPILARGQNLLMKIINARQAKEYSPEDS
ncbi:MAG: DNA translocase FtsK 4TM domain-containing protein, partial [Anaerolineales bacterium]